MASTEPVRAQQIAVVGATGVVGREVLVALEAAGHPAHRLTVLGSERSEGTDVDYGSESLSIEKVDEESFRGHAAVILAVPSDVARRLAPAAQRAGAWVVDVSPAHRKSAPLALPGINDAAWAGRFAGRIVAVPAATTTALALALDPLRRAFSVRRASVTALLGASSRGKAGVEELERQTANLLTGRELEPTQFPHRLAFNVIPQVGSFDGDWAEEELAVSEELGRLWEGAGERVTVGTTALFVPIFYGVCLVVTAELGRAVAAAEIREALSGAPAIKLLDAPGERIYPMPMLVTADPAVHVGRVRSDGTSVTFVAAIDNAGRGAANNAVEVARRLLARD